MTYQTFDATSFQNIKISALDAYGSISDIDQKLQQSLARLAAEPGTSSILSAIQAKLAAKNIDLYIFSENTDPNHSPAHKLSGSKTGLISAAEAPYYPDIPTGSIWLYVEADSASGESAFDGYTVNGLDPSGDFDMKLDRTIFHELMHSWTMLNGPDTNLQNNVDKWESTIVAPNGASFSFSEAISVAAENFFYNNTTLSYSNGDNGIRIGHTTPNFQQIVIGVDVDEGGANGFAVVPNLSNRQANTINDSSGSLIGFSFSGITTNGLSPSYVKSYYVPGYNPLGSDPSTSYDNYILYRTIGKTNSSGSTANGDNYYLFGDNAYISPYFSQFTQGVMVHDMQGGMDIAATITRHAMSVFADPYGYTDRVGGDIPYLDNFVGIGADRFADVAVMNDDHKQLVDISGPVTADSTRGTAVTTSPTKLAINDQAATDGTLIFGASGYKLEGPLPTAIDDYIDASGSFDWILAGSGNDLIIAGIGTGSVKNSIHAGAGRDVIIGREGSDNIFGGLGNDLIRPGAGNDDIHGGSGLDTVTYHDSTSGITIDMRSKTGTRGDASGDTYTQIEAFLGTPEADVFYGAGAGHFFWGGEGNDEFHLKDGDYAKGGAGADRFYLEIEPGKTVRVGIIDLDNQDSVFINGIQLTGYGIYANGSSYSLNASRYGDTAKLDLSSFGMYGSSNPISITTTAFETGDGGISPYYYGSSSYIPFNYGINDILI